MSLEDQKQGQASASAYYYGPGYGYGSPAYGESDLDSGFSVKDLIRLIRRRWEIVVCCIAIGTAAAGYWSYQQPVTYTATARLLIEPEHRVVEIDSVVDGIGSDSATIETQLNILKTNGFLESFVAEKWSADVFESHALNELLLVKGPPADSTTVLDAQYNETDHPAAIGAIITQKAATLSDGLSVAQEGRSFIINLAYTSKDPLEAAKTANDLAKYYIEDQVDTRKEITGDASDFLNERLEELEAELIKAEEAVHNYSATSRLNSPGKFSVTDERLADIVSLLVETRALRVEREARLDYLRKIKRRGGDLGSLTEVRDSPYMASLWNEESQLRIQEAELKHELGANHPRIVTLEQEQSALRARMNAEVGKIIGNMSNEVQVLVKREHSLELDMEELSGQAHKSLELSDYAAIRLRVLEGKAETSRRIYEEFLIRLKETRQQEAMVRANTRIVSSAKTPSTPSSGSPLRFMLLGLVGSSGLGLGLAYLLESANRRFRTGKDVSQFLGIPNIGLVPYLSLKARSKRKLHEYLEEKPASHFTEAFRSTFTQLIIGYESDDPPKVIQVTSTLPNEGKTTFAVSFATMLALDNKKTLLIDLDLRNPSVCREIDLTSYRSLASYLQGQSAFEDSMLAKQDTGCHVIGARSPMKDPGKAIRSEQLLSLMREMKDRYDYIIIDGPPSLGLSDSKALLSMVDALVFVVRWNFTTVDQATEAIDELKLCKAKIAGTILTQVDMKRLKRYGSATSSYSKNSKYYQD